MRFIIEKSKNKNNHWVCTDTINLIVCVFENHKFNDTQEFSVLFHETQELSVLEDKPNATASELAKAVNEMAEWLRANHYSKVF